MDGGEIIGLVAVTGIFIVLPTIIMNNVTKWKAMKSISVEDEDSLSKLREQALKLEERLRTMERILDDEVPNWRGRYYDR